MKNKIVCISLNVHTYKELDDPPPRPDCMGAQRQGATEILSGELRRIDGASLPGYKTVGGEAMTRRDVRIVSFALVTLAVLIWGMVVIICLQ